MKKRSKVIASVLVLVTTLGLVTAVSAAPSDEMGDNPGQRGMGMRNMQDGGHKGLRGKKDGMKGKMGARKQEELAEFLGISVEEVQSAHEDG